MREDGKGYELRELPMAEGEKYIYGKLYLPLGQQKVHPTVILAHGYGVNLMALSDIAELLAEAGIAAYVFDFCGGGYGTKSSGSMLDMTVETELSDLELVLHNIYDMGFADRKRIYLCGESQGGLVCALCGAKNPNMPMGLILLYPAFNIPEQTGKRFPREEDIPEKVLTMGLNVSGDYYRKAIALKPYEEIEKYPGPVLILHGDRDEIVPLSCSEKAVDIFPNASLVILEGAGHGFYDQEVPVAAQQIIGFVKEGLDETEK